MQYFGLRPEDVFLKRNSRTGLALFCGIVIKIALNVDKRRSLVTGAGSQVTQRADQVRQAAGCCALRCHTAHQAGAVFLSDFGLDGVL